MHEHAVILNEPAQGLRPMPQGVASFERLEAEHQLVVLRELADHCMQTGERSRSGQHFSLEGFASRLVEPRAELLDLVLEKDDLREADQLAVHPDR